MSLVTSENVHAFEAFLTGYIFYDDDTNLDKIALEIERSSSGLIAMYSENRTQTVTETLAIALDEGCDAVIMWCLRLRPDFSSEKIFIAAVLAGREDIAIIGLKRNIALKYVKFLLPRKLFQKKYGNIELYAAQTGLLVIIKFIYDNMLLLRIYPNINNHLLACVSEGQLEAFKLINKFRRQNITDDIYLESIAGGQSVDIMRYCVEVLNAPLPSARCMRICMLHADSANIIRYLISIGADEYPIIQNYLMDVVYKGATGLLEYHIQEGFFDINSSFGNKTALSAAFMSNNLMALYSCNDNQTILYLSGTTNAHACNNPNSGYITRICFTDIFSSTYLGTNPNQCTGTNKVVGIMSE